MNMLRFRKLIICFLLCFVQFGVAVAQRGVVEPKWVRKLPISPSEKYYFRVTYSEGRDYDSAYAKAYAKAIYENSSKRGITVDVNSSQESIENDISKQVNIDDQSMRLFLNKACEWWTENADGYIKLYVLWQIGEDGRTYPHFEPYENCYDY